MKIKHTNLLITGGSGLLGNEFKNLLPNAHSPTSNEFNIMDYKQISSYVEGKNIHQILHAAAFTSPPLIDKNPIKALETNIIGTSNIVRLCMHNKYRLIYISTDYVFRGDKGNYQEDDSVHPINKYAWSKLGGECAVRLYANSLIIRTTFGPTIFPYEKAFNDQWTNRESVVVIAKMIIPLLEFEVQGVVHVGGKRKSVLEYAISLDPTKEIKPLSIKSVNFKVPVDTSLNCSRYADLLER